MKNTALIEFCEEFFRVEEGKTFDSGLKAGGWFYGDAHAIKMRISHSNMACYDRKECRQINEFIEVFLSGGISTTQAYLNYLLKHNIPFYLNSNHRLATKYVIFLKRILDFFDDDKKWIFTTNGKYAKFVLHINDTTISIVIAPEMLRWTAFVPKHLCPICGQVLVAQAHGNKVCYSCQNGAFSTGWCENAMAAEKAVIESMQIVNSKEPVYAD